ncbi:hypothetical protein NDU88_001378 [Pleurodeles waltl]|uniref:Secreted protein n=1 Tax=Pleurodeles waltl TaxID=8319 RepID=A0AAV7P6V8_PLEWA|nr:hypothetical protein NDU88_001378 [Pleurodeles waltl]
MLVCACSWQYLLHFEATEKTVRRATLEYPIPHKQRAEPTSVFEPAAAGTGRHWHTVEGTARARRPPHRPAAQSARGGPHKAKGSREVIHFRVL